jgi:hypothetical protein
MIAVVNPSRSRLTIRKMGAFMHLDTAMSQDMEFHLKEAERFVGSSKLYHAAFHLGLARELAGEELPEMNIILPASSRPRTGSFATRQYYWRMYDAYVRKATSQNRYGADNVEFRQRGYALGNLSPELALRLQEAVMSAPIARYSSAEELPGFISSQHDSESDAAVNSHSQFRLLDSAGENLLGEALAQMRDDVASCLGSPWRVVAVKSWTTPPGRPPIDMYGWHGDAWVGELYKIMIYLTPMTRRTGGLEIFVASKEIFLESTDPGKWVLFRNSDLLHRGVPGTDSVRAVIEISLARALTYDLRLRIPGLNVHWPELPWVDALDQNLRTTQATSSLKTAETSSSMIKKPLVRLVNHFGKNRRLFKWRRRAERLKRLYFSFHPQ